MKKKILIGSIIAVVLLVLMSFSPSITANVSKPDIDVVEDVATPTPIVLVLQLISKLRNHKDIQYVESEDDVIRIIERDEELNSIVEQLSSYDCGCDSESSTLEWGFPVVCVFLLIPLNLGFKLFLLYGSEVLIDIIADIGRMFNCWWV